MALLKVQIIIQTFPEDIVIETTCEEDTRVGDLLEFYKSETNNLHNRRINLIDSADTTWFVDTNYRLTFENISESKEGYVQLRLFFPCKGFGGPGRKNPSKLKKKELLLRNEELSKDKDNLYLCINRLRTFNSNRKAAMYELRDRIKELEKENALLKANH